MINPDMIHSVKEGASGWQVFQCGLPIDDAVYDTRELACERILRSIAEQARGYCQRLTIFG